MTVELKRTKVNILSKCCAWKCWKPGLGLTMVYCNIKNLCKPVYGNMLLIQW